MARRKKKSKVKQHGAQQALNAALRELGEISSEKPSEIFVHIGVALGEIRYAKYVLGWGSV